MISQHAELPIVAFSVRVYKMLLAAYPTRFQQEYGPHMVQVFRDCCLRTIRQGEMNGILKLWVVTLLDLLQSVVSEHRQKEIEMKKEMKPQDIRMAGWALILGSVVFSLGIFTGALQTNNWYVMITLVALISMPLLAFGLLGLRRQYGDQAGGFGKNILLIGAVLGSLMSVIGYFGEAGLFGRGYDSSWVLMIFAGPMMLFACLALFGVVALFKKPLPRWNILPILAGLWFPIRIGMGIITALLTGDWPADDTLSIADAVFITLQGVSLVALGYVLKSDVPEESVVAA
jgi:uncharacterized membrane protein YgdD (TMEM256/DUF423 family)